MAGGRMRPAVWVLASLAGVAGAAASGAGPESTAPASPDADLLEFLGSLDAEGEGWLEYLASEEAGRRLTGRPAPKDAPKGAAKDDKR
jgi:hypothetical protein